MTRKKYWMRIAKTLLLVMLTALDAKAEQVTVEEALQQAQAFLANLTAGPRRVPSASPQLISAGKIYGLYVFNTTDQSGFVIVSNDDATYPILGFSESGSLDPDSIPSNMRGWLQGYADQIAWIRKQEAQGVQVKQNGQRRASCRVGSHSTVPIGPLINTTWGQKIPYNNLCPMYSSTKRAASGCVATAMAQVMYYHQWPKSYTSAIPGYTTATLKINLTAGLPITTFDWDNMRLSYSDSYSEVEANAVATLMQYCGYSVLMDYNESSGGCFACVDRALKDYFDYDETIKLVYHDSYSEAEWTDLIYNELAHERPVIYTGNTSINTGHAFVCDGYKYENNNDYFHINWGWDGWCDNYFLLSALDPLYTNFPSLSYNYDQSAVVGIENSTNIRITATEVGTHSAVLSWTGKGSDNAWVVAYKGEGDSDFTEVNVTENPFTLTGLSPETKYFVKVRRYSETDKWSNTIYFTTDIACPAPTLVLVNDATNNSSLIEEYDGESIVVKLADRTLYKDNLWNTICLPFDVDLTDENCPLYGAKARTLANATIDGSYVTLYFTNDLTMLEDGIPYIIKWDSGNNIINPVFYGVTIKNSTLEERTISTANGHVKFVGYYDAFDITKENDNIFYLTAGNQLKCTGIDRTLKACRAYFQFSGDIVENARKFVLNFDDGESIPTGICLLEEVTLSDDEWYSFDGRKLGKRPTAKGVYIHNGRKDVIK